MYRLFDRTAVPALALAAAMAAAGPAPARAAPQQEAASAAPEIVSISVSTSSDAAELTLGLSNDRALELALDEGTVRVDGDAVGSYSPGGELDRSWRELLGSLAGDVGAGRSLLVNWDAPGDGAGDRLDSVLEAALGGAVVTTADADQQDAKVIVISGDSEDTIAVARLNARIEEIQERLDDNDLDQLLTIDPDELEQQIRAEIEHELRMERHDHEGLWGGSGRGPLDYIWHGLAGIFSVLTTYAVLLGLGFAMIFFGGRKYLEGVADTARHATVRSGLVGLAGSFLLLPAFILGIVALAASIVGIPLLLAWVPLFPLAAALAAVLGYLGVAHAAGEKMAERRFYGGEWFKRANSYYYLLTGLGLLLVLFIASNVVGMAGPWFDWIQGLIIFAGVVLTWACFTVGFGAVLLSRAGTEPAVTPPPSEPNVGTGLGEESHV